MSNRSTKKIPRETTRTSAITVRLDPKIMDGLTELSEKLGIAQSTLAGLAIGEYVVRGLAAYSAPAIMQKACGEELARTIGAPMAAMFQNMEPEKFLELANKIED